MGSVVEEFVNRKAVEEGLMTAQQKAYNDTKHFIESKGVYNILKRTIFHLLPSRVPYDFELKMDGGSYTNGRKIVVAALSYAWGMPHAQVYSILKALTGHESEHICSSDFKLFRNFQNTIAEDFDRFLETGVLGDFKIVDKSEEQYKKDFAKFNFNKRYGAKLGAHLLNSVEDGRIEKRLGNRMRGYVKHIKFMNALIWENQPVNGKDQLQEFLFSLTSMCVTGLKSKDWEKVYGGTDLDDLLNQIRPLIIKGINEPTSLGCAERTFEIYRIIAPKVAELLEKNKDAMDDMSENMNFSGTSAEGDGNNSPSNNSVSTHFAPEQQDENQENGSNEQKSGQSSEQGEDEKGEDGQNSSNGLSKGGQKGNKEKGQDGQNSSDDTNGSKGKGGKKGQKEDSNDLTDHSEDHAKEEAKLVKDFLKNAGKELEKELDKEMNQIKKEEEKIQAEEERKAKESGSLSDSELQDVLQGRGVQRFSIEKLNVRPVHLSDDIALPGKKLHRQLEEILMDKQGYTSRNRKRGTLDTTGIWKLGVKDYNTFIKKGKPDNSSYAVSVLVDNSGSMNERAKSSKRKADFAKEACAILEEGLKGLVPFRITRFDNNYRGVRHQVISDFGDTDKLNRSYSVPVMTGASNADSISIRVAAEELLKRNETKKILFVLSDGLPSAYYNEKDAISSVQNAVRDARKAGVIVIAICFGSQQHLDNTRDSYRKMYQKGIIMTEPQNIPTQLVKVLEREIK